MKRSIIGFHQDERGDWVADLDCGHGLHARHRPPFTNRPWVVSERGRAAMVGRERDCLKCDRGEWPAGMGVDTRTPEFDEASIPAGLLKGHATKAGVWGRIHVLEGRLDYCVEGTGRRVVVEPSAPGVIVPQVRHRIEAPGRVRFFVEFFRKR